MSLADERVAFAYAKADATGTDGHEWMDAFEAACFEVGLVYDGGPCTCSNEGEFGHLPHCGLEAA